jgi:peptidoglycan/xylan/chitin deacetylase (PgdA/CDA1 family)
MARARVLTRLESVTTGQWEPTVSAKSATKQRRALAMTFDDLPLQRTLPADDALPPLEVLCDINGKLLELVTANGIPAVGFVNEGRLHDYEDSSARRRVLEMWLDAGLQLGNHTFSHLCPETSTLQVYCDDVVRGEGLIRTMLAERGQRLTFFRHPQLHTGPDREYKSALERFLCGRGYRVAPVTIKHQDWAFAVAYAGAWMRRDASLAERVVREYLTHLTECFAFFEGLSAELLGYELRQSLLLHVNQLNADCFGRIVEMISARGYEFISLDQVLADDAYLLADEYVGTRGPSWLHRWAHTKGLAVHEEPRLPDFIKRLLEMN